MISFRPLLFFLPFFYFVLFSLISFCFRFISFSFRFVFVDFVSHFIGALIFFLPFSSYQSISFCFRWFRFISFRFHFIDFVSFLFRFALYRYPSFWCRFTWSTNFVKENFEKAFDGKLWSCKRGLIKCSEQEARFKKYAIMS